jgi:hypothetical protein
LHFFRLKTGLFLWPVLDQNPSLLPILQAGLAYHAFRCSQASSQAQEPTKDRLGNRIGATRSGQTAGFFFRKMH